MNQHKALLLVVLLVQLALASWLYFGQGFAASSGPGLAEFDVAALAAIEITDAKANTLRLEQTPAGWRVGEYPADSVKVEAMLRKLGAVQASWPVATSSAAQTRFEVAPEKFQRRLQLYQDASPTLEVLFGTSPGFRRVHARAATTEDIYSIDFANHELPVGEDDWLDRGLLALQNDVVSVQRIDHWSLTRSSVKQSSGSDLGWELNGGLADVGAAATLVGRFANLQVLGSVVFEGQLSASFAVTTQAGDVTQDFRYALYHNAELDKYYVTRDDQAGRFEMASYIAEQMLLDVGSLEPQPADAQNTGDLTEQIVDQALQDLSGPETP